MRLTVKLRDYSDEYTLTGINVADIDGIVRLWTTSTGEADDLVTHLEAHSLGTVATVQATQATQAENDVRPADPFDQREYGFRFYLRDSVNNELGYFTIGTADLDIGSVVAGQDNLDLSAAPTAAFVTWLEANALSRDGNAVVVERAIVVGRNS